MASSLWPLGIYFLLAITLAVVMLAISYVLGQRHRDPHTGTPYEGGIAPTGTARVRFSAKFYLVAMLFVIFDLESAFIFAWAIVGRELGWGGYVEVAIFIGVLLIALVYLWRVGALDWAPRAEDIHKRKNVHGETASKRYAA